MTSQGVHRASVPNTHSLCIFMASQSDMLFPLCDRHFARLSPSFPLLKNMVSLCHFVETFDILSAICCVHQCNWEFF